jgi:hypothetical protein
MNSTGFCDKNPENPKAAVAPSGRYRCQTGRFASDVYLSTASLASSWRGCQAGRRPLEPTAPMQENAAVPPPESGGRQGTRRGSVASDAKTIFTHLRSRLTPSAGAVVNAFGRPRHRSRSPLEPTAPMVDDGAALSVESGGSQGARRGASRLRGYPFAIATPTTPPAGAAAKKRQSAPASRLEPR